jgi:hypothetical protein
VSVASGIAESIPNYEGTVLSSEVFGQLGFNPDSEAVGSFFGISTTDCISHLVTGGENRISHGGKVNAWERMGKHVQLLMESKRSPQHLSQGFAREDSQVS